MIKWERKTAYGMVIGLVAVMLSGCHMATTKPTEATPENMAETPMVELTQGSTEKPTPEIEADEDIVESTAEETVTEPDLETPAETETELVTSEATEAPTQKPTQAATQAPTQKPTQAATQAPTQKPTQAATQAPTQKPTQAATQAPTQKPTQIQTTSAMAQPTKFDVGSNKDVYEKSVALYESNLSRAQAMLNAINAARERNGVGALVLDQKLSYSAGMRAVEMDYGNYFGHERYNGSDKYATAIQYVGINYMACGEVLAKGYDNMEQAVEAWMGSSYHQPIIISAKYHKMGFGYCNVNGNMIVVVQFTD